MRRLLLLIAALSLSSAPAIAADACLVVLECATPAPDTTTTTTPAPGDPPPPAASAVEPDPAARLLELTNAARSEVGVAPLAPRPEVATIAMGWSAVMAERGELAHNDDYFTPAVRARLGAAFLGENVAYAGDIESAHATLMASPHHRDNLLDARFDVVGMAAVRHEGRWWVTQDFAQIAVPAAAPPPALSVDATSPTPSPAASRYLPTADAPSSGAENDGVAAAQRLAEVVQRSWDSASARMRWRWSPRRTSSS